MSDAAEIRLRPATAADSERLFHWRNLPEVARWMYSDHVITPDEHARWIATALPDPSRRYWIIEMDGTPVGLANLVDIDHGNRKASWAYYLADPAVRGKGVGAFVEVWVIDHAFRELRLNKLCCEVLIENEAVWKMHEGFGFLREALYREHVWKDGAPRDVVGLGLLARDWAKVRGESVARLRDRGFVIPD
jgi:UDP-4-amino-4,6-dideoxy-N-acetyl-beta-L-altrosamine N-acetyltransferase